MNKSKFKAVRFKPFDIELCLQDKSKGLCWTNSVAFGKSVNNDVYFTDSCIEAYPELFEVEKAEREFEEGALYKAKYVTESEWEVIKYMYGGFYRMASNQKYAKQRFSEIGEKIEL